MRIVWPVITGLLLLAGVDCYAQQPMERVYADDQTFTATPVVAYVVDPEKSVDNDVTSHSTLNTIIGLLGLVGSASQNLTFTGPSLPAPNTPITVKIGFGSSVLDLLGGVTVQATLNGSPVGTAYSGSALLGLLGGSNQSEVTFTPGTNYNGVRVSVKPTLGLGVSVQVFHAYFMQPVPGPVICNEVVDVLYGVGTYGVNAAGATATVSDEWNSVDQNLDTYSTMTIGVQALAYVHQTVVYNNPSKLGDSIRVVLSDPGGLLELELLTNFQIQAYLGNQEVGPLIDGSSDLLDIDLLGLLGTPGTKVIASYAPPGVQFDRIQIRLESVVGLLDGIRVHQIERVAPKPIIAGFTDNILTICEGEPVTLTIINPEANAIYRWFDAAENGTEITSGVSADGTLFTPAGLTVGSHEFYVSVTREGCNDEASERTKITVIVIEGASAADIDVVTNDPFCLREDVVLTPSSPTITDPVFKWYHDQNKTQPITNAPDGTINYQIEQDGTLTITGLAVGTYEYYVSVSNLDQCENVAGTLKKVVVTVDALPAPPVITLTP
ncbi:hypothetical protein EDD80_105105 [Anseongella ginsenosidimutans]|uniref:Ig-like domain-containing protein n=2 Tax=Anseongella ginsenosidimutans TaxID=496056 RepID=A0A4R3KRD2_9SPHI|nr:hypothetical protein EDD80_105105 [Anseongella ginsenosidimutans]